MTKYTKTFADAMKEVRKPKVVNEFKKMTVSFKSHDAMAKASTDLAKQGFTITGNKDALKVDGKGADLNKYATDLKNFYGATVKAESLEEDYEVSMAIGQLRTINEYATKLISILEAKGSDYNIEAWVQSKITTAEDYMNSVGHYMENNPEITNEAKEEEPGKDGKIGPAGKIALAKEKDTDALEAQIVDLKGRLALAQQKIENEKNKAVKPVPNPETGESRSSSSHRSCFCPRVLPAVASPAPLTRGPGLGRSQRPPAQKTPAIGLERPIPLHSRAFETDQVRICLGACPRALRV